MNKEQIRRIERYQEKIDASRKGIVSQNAILDVHLNELKELTGSKDVAGAEKQERTLRKEAENLQSQIELKLDNLDEKYEQYL